MLGLAVADKPDSHDICFIQSPGGTREWLTQRLGVRSGDIVEPDGTVVGRHDGATGYTVGQRRGLGLRRPAGDGTPRYVLSTDPARNLVVVGPERLLDIDEVVGGDVRWCGPPAAEETAAGVQLRAHGQEIPGVSRIEGAQLVVRLHRPTRGVAPGQTMVLYHGTRVVGSATIIRTGRRAA